MLSSSLDTLLKASRTTSPRKLFGNDCVTLYIYFIYVHNPNYTHKVSILSEEANKYMVTPANFDLYLVTRPFLDFKLYLEFLWDAYSTQKFRVKLKIMNNSPVTNHRSK